jgi:hypothetical protein
VPQQHGAWAMLASPLLVGIIAGGPTWVDVPLTAFWFTGYFAFSATSLWLKSGRRAKWFPPVQFYGLLAAGLGLVVALMRPDLIRWVPVFAVPLAVGLWAAATRHERDLLAGLTTVLACGLITVVAYDAGTTGTLTRGWQLGLVQFLYFAGTVFYVKTVIRERDNTAFYRLSVAVHAAATVLMAWLSWWLVLVFALLTARAAVVPRLRPGGRPVTPRNLGIAEVFSTICVSVVSLIAL